MRSKSHDGPVGFVLLDKPPGLTSHDVVAKVRRALHTRRVGHAGTLDPMATGVLVLGVGAATRLLSLASDAHKTYTATIRLGQSTTTDDAEGDVVTAASTAHVDEAAVRQAGGDFVGQIWQRPSAVSAIKVGGRRAYERVRAGEDVTLAARQVTVESFEVQDSRRTGPGGAFVDVDVRVRCGTGTYIRALARDLGGELGTGGHLTALRRVESAGIDVEECLALDAFTAEPQVRSVRSVVSHWLPVHNVDADTVVRLRHGQRVPWEGLAAQKVAIAGPDGDIAAVATVTEGTLAPSVVLATTGER